MILHVYFSTTTAALAAKVSLGALYGCSQPMHVPPEQGKAVMLVVRIPSGFVLNGKPTRQVMARVVQIANRYDGLVIDTEELKATP